MSPLFHTYSSARWVVIDGAARTCRELQHPAARAYALGRSAAARRAGEDQPLPATDSAPLPGQTGSG